MIMGRKTFESIIRQFGRPLPNRRHLVLTRNPERIDHPVAECHPNLQSALDAVREEPLVFVAGGAAVYGSTIEQADRLELTIVEGDYDGDAYFPPWKHYVGTLFELSFREDHSGFRYETYLKRHI